MKKVRLNLEFGAYPLWILGEDGTLIDTAAPKELKEDEVFLGKLDKMQRMYESLFVNDAMDFEYIGDTMPGVRKEVEKFFKEIEEDLKEKVGDSYEIEVWDLKLEG